MSNWTREALESIIKKNGCKFRGMSLHQADFSGMNLERADFRGARLPYANFSGANLRFADFEGAECFAANFTKTNLHRANFKDANLSEADFTELVDAFGITMTMECRSFMGLKMSQGWWYGFIFYALLMKAPVQEDADRLAAFMGKERYEVLRNQYAARRM